MCLQKLDEWQLTNPLETLKPKLEREEMAKKPAGLVSEPQEDFRSKSTRGLRK